MDEIKPVAYRQYYERDYERDGCDGEFKLWEVPPGMSPPEGTEPLYPQQVIDTLRAEVERQKELISDLNSIISGIPAELRRASQAKQELADFLIARAERAEAEADALRKYVDGRWDEWLSHALSKWPEAEAALIATRVALGPTAAITQDDIDFAKREAL